MVSSGENIKNTSDVLKKVSIQYLYEAIKDSKPTIEARIRQLRIVRQLNPSQYSQLKSQLPYFVCAVFNPRIRKNIYFAYTEYFILDIDHIGEKGFILEELKSKISTDPRVLMCFVSPGGDGLKVMFRFSNRCYDSSVYKLFYQLFAKDFSDRYDLSQVIDTRTCDVSRACFISSDPNIYYNPSPEAIDINNYVDTYSDASSLVTLMKGLKKEAAEVEKKERTEIEDAEPSREPGDEVMSKIRQTLNPDSKLQLKKMEIYVPKELDAIMDGLIAFVEERGIQLYEIQDINYGKKLKFQLGFKKAEINLFFGKQGFSIVKSPKTGTNREFNTLMADVVEAFIVEKL